MIISVVIYFVTAKIVQEVIGLALNIQDNWSNIVSAFEELETWIAKQVVILPGPAVELLENMTENVLNFIQNFSSNLLTHTVSSTGWIISRTGTFSLNFITFFLALYFLMSDFNRIRAFFIERIDRQLLNSLSLFKNSALKWVVGYIKTQLILAGIAFVFMFIAFTPLSTTL